jgi:cell wall-associated NlpC family hydrolase
MPCLFRKILFISLIFFLFSCAGTPSAPHRRDAMQEIIKSYLGTPYKWGGSSRRGIDCSGLIMRVYEGVGVYLPRTADEQSKLGKRVGFNQLTFGDILLFKTGSEGKKREILHTGLFLGDGRFVHASVSRGVVIESIQENHWKASFVEARRLESFNP